MNDGPRSVDAALADLALVAVARLQVEMTTAKNSKDRIAAANSILDRLGYSRTPRVQADVADAEIRRALDAALRGNVSESTARQLEEMKSEQEKKLGEIEEPKRLTRAQEVANGQALYDETKAESDRVSEVEWAAAEPSDEDEENMRDFSQLGPDDEETDKWLLA